MSASNDSDRRQEAEAASGQSAGTAATSAAAGAGASPPVKTTAWIPKVKQQQQQQQSGDRRSSTSSSTGQVHDLGSDPINASGSESGTGKGKNRSKNKKMNWKPLAVPIIRRDPDRDRDRDIRGVSARKYGASSATSGGHTAPTGASSSSSGGRHNKQSLANGFRQMSAPAAGATSATSGHVQHQLSHPGTAVTTPATGSSNNNADPHHGHPPLPSQHSHNHSNHNNNNNNNNNHQHHHNHNHQSAQSNSSDESKLQRSSSVSSSSSSSRPNHHQHHNHPPHHHQHHMLQKQQQPDPHAQPHHSDQTSNASSNASGESSSSSRFSNNNNSSNNNHNYNHQRMANGNNRLPAASRPPVLRSAGPSPPVSPAQPHHNHHQHQQQHHNRRQVALDHQPQPQHQSQPHQPYYGRRSATRVPTGSTNGGSGRATPNSLKDFSPEVQFFPVEYAALNPDMTGAGAPQMGNKTSGLMSPVLTLPPGAVVVQAPAFAGPAGATPPFYPPYATAIPVVTAGSAGHLGQTAAVSVPSGLILTMPSLPSDPLHGHLSHHNHQSPLMDRIRAQIEYYFSEKNLVRDFFIRSHMDSEGFLPISLIASFRRIQELTPDVTVIIRSLEASSTVELSPDHVKARPRINPHLWPMTTTDMANLSSPPPPVLSPMSPLPAGSSAPITNGLNDVVTDPHVTGAPAGHVPVKSLNERSAAGAGQGIGSVVDQEAAARSLSQLQVSDAGDKGNAEMTSASTGASNPDQKTKQQSAVSSASSLNSSAAGRGSNGSVSQKQQSSSSPSSSSAATESDVTPAATSAAASPPASDASASLHPDVPSFVPGQLYAAVVSNNGTNSSSKV